jgi:hypothetical protein
MVGIVSFLYAVAFVILQNNLLSALFLMLGGLLSSGVVVAIYNRLREPDAAFALWALMLGIAGALGSAVHGGYDLANAINPVDSTPSELPNPIDPRGLLAFGVAGVALLVIAWLIMRGGRFPRGLGYVAYVSAALLIILYLGRLIVLEATSPVIVLPALLNGFLVNPALYLWLGVAVLSRREATTQQSRYEVEA